MFLFPQRASEMMLYSGEEEGRGTFFVLNTQFAKFECALESLTLNSATFEK